MAEYIEAFDFMIEHEGGWVDDPSDRGGETYCGISRIHHPWWTGWGKVDAIQDKASMTVDDRVRVHPDVMLFYRDHYWNVILGNLIHHQRIANKLFDLSVNLGIRTAVRYLQRTLNLLNDNGKRWDDLEVDGIFGRKTLAVLNGIPNQYKDTVLTFLKVYQGWHYVEIMESRPVQERFAIGWGRRVDEG